MAEVFTLWELANATNQLVIVPPGKGNLKGSEGQDSESTANEHQEIRIWFRQKGET